MRLSTSRSIVFLANEIIVDKTLFNEAIPSIELIIDRFSASNLYDGTFTTDMGVTTVVIVREYTHRTYEAKLNIRALNGEYLFTLDCPYEGQERHVCFRINGETFRRFIANLYN